MTSSPVDDITFSEPNFSGDSVCFSPDSSIDCFPEFYDGLGILQDRIGSVRVGCDFKAKKMTPLPKRAVEGSQTLFRGGNK